MKPLNRPMFRYGGPIKEGVMSGIREPKKNGGLMNEPQAINTVGSPLAPQGSDGRQQYALPLLGPLAMAAGRALARPFGKFVAKRIPQFFAGPNKQYGGTGKKIFEAGFKKKAPTVVFEPNKFGLAFKNDPLAKTVMGGTTMVGRGIKKAGKGIYAAGKYGTTTPSGIALTGATAGPFIYNALTGEKEPNINTDNSTNTFGGGKRKRGTSGAPGGGDPGMFLPGQGDASKKGGGVELSAEELRKKNVERYRDIMDIKGMNKDAAYNSLIAASQAISGSGDFKGDIKSGKLINQIIQATSKQFDKPKQTKDAIDTLILKGEIEKDIKASDPQNQKRAALLEKQIALADKQLAGESLSDTVNKVFERTGQFPSGKNLASVARTKGIDVKMVIKSEDINNFVKQNPGKDALDFMEIQVGEAQKSGTPIEPGAYVVKDRIIVIDSEGNVSPYL
jgi:hypothetical protein